MFPYEHDEVACQIKMNEQYKSEKQLKRAGASPSFNHKIKPSHHCFFMTAKSLRILKFFVYLVKRLQIPAVATQQYTKTEFNKFFVIK